MAVFDRAMWVEIAEALGLDEHPPPRRRPRPERVAIAKDATEAGYTTREIGRALRISQQAVSNMLRGEERWREVEGRGPAKKPKRPAGEPAPAPAQHVDAEPWPVDEPEPGGPWWNDDDDDDDEPEAPAPRRATRARAKPREPQPFGTIWTPMVEAALARRGLDRLGRPIGQEAAVAAQGPATPAAVVPAPIPSPPALRPPVAANGSRQARPAPSIPPRAVAAEARLRCGCVAYLPMHLARAGARVGCTGKHGGTAVVMLTGRFELA